MLSPQQEAKRILQEHGGSSRPVDVELIAKKLGAEIVYKPLEAELCGMIFNDGKNVVIGINESHPPARKRFTLAHEIGHLVMHSHILNGVHVDKTFRQKLYRDGRSKIGEDRIEIDANKFAAELLMPTEFLLKDVKGAFIDPEAGPTELAKLYEVSPQAMSIKLMELLGDKYFAY
jgi:Zn-dependent peptidase ImmA (M78 family)